ncbi:response regulator [Arenicella sp. 4NH20-0111]|uniref:response regulator n=1 Tax=Arenicella sp. 4NH20-0111 TaxID=3127648 RepID=UPI00310427B0
MFKLMIVDDSMLIRKKIERECDQRQFNVVGTAEDGAAAISLFKKVSPDVVTMDLTMPHLDGIECIKGLVKLQPKVRILVISALNDKATGIKALEKGAMGFVTKPFSGQELQSALGEIIDDDV